MKTQNNTGEKWKIDSAEPRRIYSENDGKIIAECMTNRNVEEDEANAKRIINAVNCYDDMLEALKECKTYLASFIDESKMKKDIKSMWLTKLDKYQRAIAKAEGK